MAMLGYQFLILVTVLGARGINPKAMWAVAAGWTLFTLFGSIFTAWLMLLQLAVIAGSVKWGLALKSARPKAGEEPPMQNSTPSPPPAAPPAPEGTIIETYYDTLEVSPRASAETVKAAYRSLIVRFHPDRNPGDPRATARSKQINVAYEVLSDPARRAAYDVELARVEFAAIPKPPTSAAHSPGRSAPPAPPPRRAPTKSAASSPTARAATAAAPGAGRPPTLGGRAKRAIGRAVERFVQVVIGLGFVALVVGIIVSVGSWLQDGGASRLIAAHTAAPTATASPPSQSSNEPSSSYGQGLEFLNAGKAASPPPLSPNGAGPVGPGNVALFDDATTTASRPTQARFASQPDSLDALSHDDQFAIGLACSSTVGVADHRQCVARELASIGNPTQSTDPLARLSHDDQFAIGLACSSTTGVADHRRCIARELNSIGNPAQSTDPMAALSHDDRFAIGLACSSTVGVADHRRCVQRELASIGR